MPQKFCRFGGRVGGPNHDLQSDAFATDVAKFDQSIVNLVKYEKEKNTFSKKKRG